MDTFQSSAGHVEVPGLGGAASQAHCIKVSQQFLYRVVDAYINSSAEDNALILHQFNAAAHHVFVQLEVGSPQHQQAANVIGPPQDSNPVSRPVKLLGGGQPARAGTDYSHFL